MVFSRCRASWSSTNKAGLVVSPSVVGVMPIHYLPLPTRRFPQALIERSRFNGNPVAFARVSTSANHFTHSHMSIEISGRQRPNTSFSAIELLGECGGVKSSGGTASLHRFPVDEGRQLDYVTFSADGTGIDIRGLQWMGLITFINGYPLSPYRPVSQDQHCEQDPEPNPIREHGCSSARNLLYQPRCRSRNGPVW